MRTVACVIDDGFTPFEFGIACEAFALDRSDDGFPNFDFRVVAPDPGPMRSSVGVTLNVEDDLSFAYEADLVVFCPVPRERWGSIDPRLIAVAQDAVTRGAWVLSVCSGAFILAGAGVLDGPLPHGRPLAGSGGPPGPPAPAGPNGGVGGGGGGGAGGGGGGGEKGARPGASPGRSVGMPHATPPRRGPVPDPPVRGLHESLLAVGSTISYSQESWRPVRRPRSTRCTWKETRL